MYGALLGMRRIDPSYIKLRDDSGATPDLGFEGDKRVVIAKPEGGQRFPMLSFQHAQFPAARWPDPRYPAQLHLDLRFDDKEAARDLAERLGAIRLPGTGGGCLTYADPASHPFDLCGEGD